MVPCSYEITFFSFLPDPLENCHLNVKNLQKKTWHFLFKLTEISLKKNKLPMAI